MAHISLLLLIFRFFISMFVVRIDTPIPMSTTVPEETEIQAQSEKEDYYALLLTAEETQVSPSGKYVLEYVSYDAEGQIPASRFDIYTNDEAHTLVHESQQELMRRFTHFIFWDPNPDIDRAWLYDSDKGVFFVEEKDGEWLEYAGRRDAEGGEREWYLSSGDSSDGQAQVSYPGEVEIPELLRVLRPNIFSQE